MNPVSRRLLDQQLICPQFTSPHDVVAYMGVMQAQDYKGMRWAVGMRTQKPSLKAFGKDFDEGRIFREGSEWADENVIRDELTEERWKGLDFYIHRDGRTRGFRSRTIHLLPAYDEYLIGYKSRHVALHPDHRHRAHDQKGVFWPVLLQVGEVIGNWTVSKGEVDIDIFKEGIVPDRDGLNAEIAQYQRFLAR